MLSGSVLKALEANDSLQVVDVVKLRPGQAAKQLPIIAKAVDGISNNQVVPQEKQDAFQYSSPVGLRLETADDDMKIILQSYFYRAFKNSDGVVFVVTGMNEETIEEELKKFDKYILKNDETRNMLVMILANEQDKEGALSHEEIVTKIGEELSEYDPMLGGRTLFIRGCNSQTKVGLEEAFSHFAQIIQLRSAGHIIPGFHNFTEDELCEISKKRSYSWFYSENKKFDK